MSGMNFEKIMRTALGRTVAASLVLSSVAWGQQAPSPINPTSTMDVYGNARPSLPARRHAAAMLTPLQQEAFRGYQTRGRRVDRRGGFSGFALPSDRLPFGRIRGLRGFASPAFGGRPGFGRSPSFSQYGGFSRRGRTNDKPEVATTLRRRRELIGATGLNAPVHRALERGEGTGLLRSTVGGTPFMRPIPAADSSDSSVSATLDEMLRSSAAREYDRIQLRAWRWLHDGAYRSAARAFETASLMEPSSVPPRIGVLFAHLGLRADATTKAIVSELSRRATSPFLTGLNLSDAFADASVVRRLRITAQTVAVSDNVSRQNLALQTLVFWYLGEPDEAMGVARRLVARPDGSAFAAWPDWILVATRSAGED